MLSKLRVATSFLALAVAVGGLALGGVGTASFGAIILYQLCRLRRPG